MVEIPVEEWTVMANNFGPILWKLVLLFVVSQAVFPRGRELTEGAGVVLQNSFLDALAYLGVTLSVSK